MRNASQIAITFRNFFSLMRCSIPNTLPLPRCELPRDLLQRVQHGYLALAVVQLQLFESGFKLVQATDDSGRHFLRLRLGS